MNGKPLFHSVSLCLCGGGFSLNPVNEPTHRINMGRKPFALDHAHGNLVASLLPLSYLYFKRAESYFAGVI